MPRPKGSKNKKKAVNEVDLGAQIAEKKAELDALNDEYEEISTIVAENNAKLRDIKKNSAKVMKDIAKLEAKKAEEDAAAAVSAKKEELQATIDKLLADGKSIDDILDKLK